jgi:amphi-Trp domain-containing protein
MQNGDGSFRHESLQSRKSIKALLEAVTKGIGKGELTLSDGDEEIVLEPGGLITVRVALLHKSADGRGSPFPGQTYPTASVTGMPSAV